MTSPNPTRSIKTMRKRIGMSALLISRRHSAEQEPSTPRPQFAPHRPINDPSRSPARRTAIGPGSTHAGEMVGGKLPVEGCYQQFLRTLWDRWRRLFAVARIENTPELAEFVRGFAQEVRSAAGPVNCALTAVGFSRRHQSTEE